MVWEGSGVELLYTAGLGRKWEGIKVFVDEGRKWEGKFKFYKQEKEPGRKKCGFFIWEGKRGELDHFRPIFFQESEIPLIPVRENMDQKNII